MKATHEKYKFEELIFKKGDYVVVKPNFPEFPAVIGQIYRIEHANLKSHFPYEVRSGSYSFYLSREEVFPASTAQRLLGEI